LIKLQLFLIYSKETIINPLIAIINPSSIIVIVSIGRLKMASKWADYIFFLFTTACKTPIMLIVITIKAIKVATNGLK
jgi:hypothetical protein